MPRKCQLSLHDEAMIIRSYADGVSLARLAKRYGCTPATVKRVLMSYGVEIRREHVYTDQVIVRRDVIVINGRVEDKEAYLERETARIREGWTAEDYKRAAGNPSGVPGRVSVGSLDPVESPGTMRGRNGSRKSSHAT